MPNETLKTLTMPIKSGGTATPKTYDIPQGDVKQTELDSLLTDYAKKEGTYEDLVAGSANQLIPSAMETEKVPYNFRTSGGSLDIGDREFDKLVGGTVAWNQLVKNGNFANTNNWSGQYCSISASGNVLTAEATAENVAGRIEQEVTLIAGHKYLFKENIKVSANATSRFAYRYSGGIKYTASLNATANTWGELATVFSADTQGDSGMLYLYYSNSTALAVGGTAQYKNVMLIDLTQMFGSTIADYIYSLETATAGAGIAWFKKLFPKPYYAYNAGELMSVQAASHDTVGFNQFNKDDTTDWKNFALATGKTVTEASAYRSAIIKCVPNATYYACKTKGARIGLASFPNYPVAGDVATNADWNNTGLAVQITTGANDRYLLVWFYNGNVDSSIGVTAIAETLNVNLSWDGARDGEYEPYKKNSYALDPIELRGILKLDSNNEPYADGDTYEADGTVTRRFAIVTYDGSSDETWVKETGDKFYIAKDDMTRNLGTANVYDGYIICDKLPTFNGYTNSEFLNATFGITGYNGTSYAGQNWIYVRANGATTATELKTWLASNPITVVYELATPTTESADPFTDPQTVDNWGTEQYVDKAYTDGDRDVEIPVGHETKYPVNLRDKVETSPNAPTSDGDYIVHCESGQLTYIALGSTTTIQNIIARLEELEP